MRRGDQPFPFDYPVTVNCRRVDAFIALSKVRELDDISDSEVSITSVTLRDLQNNRVTHPTTGDIVNLVNTQGEIGAAYGSYTSKSPREHIPE